MAGSFSNLSTRRLKKLPARGKAKMANPAGGGGKSAIQPMPADFPEGAVDAATPKKSRMRAKGKYS